MSLKCICAFQFRLKWSNNNGHEDLQPFFAHEVTVKFPDLKSPAGESWRGNYSPRRVVGSPHDDITQQDERHAPAHAKVIDPDKSDVSGVTHVIFWRTRSLLTAPFLS